MLREFVKPVAGHGAQSRYDRSFFDELTVAGETHLVAVRDLIMELAAIWHQERFVLVRFDALPN